MAASTFPYRSPAGTFERILKSALEDYSLTDAEHRLLTYLAGKPPGWQLIPEVAMRELGRSAYWLRTARAGLVRRGYIVTGRERDEAGHVNQKRAVLRRELVIYFDENQNLESGPTWENAVSPQVTPGSVSPPAGEADAYREDSVLSDDSCKRARARGEDDKAAALPDSKPRPDSITADVILHYPGTPVAAQQLPGRYPDIEQMLAGIRNWHGSEAERMLRHAIHKLFPAELPVDVRRAFLEWYDTRSGNAERIEYPERYIESVRPVLLRGIEEARRSRERQEAELHRQDLIRQEDERQRAEELRQWAAIKPAPPDEPVAAEPRPVDFSALTAGLDLAMPEPVS